MGLHPTYWPQSLAAIFYKFWSVLVLRSVLDIVYGNCIEGK